MAAAARLPMSAAITTLTAIPFRIKRPRRRLVPCTTSRERKFPHLRLPRWEGGSYPTFSAKRVTCPALNLSSKGASTGIQTIQTDFLKNMFGGEKGAPTPAGIRMHGIYAAPTGFSVQFFPESAVLGCGPDAARAYPYSSCRGRRRRAVVNIAARPIIR